MEIGTAPVCSKDKFPKVKIEGRWQCVAEYLDHCIGGQRIVDLVEREGTVYYVFESGHELPMLCYCCGMPMQYADLEGARCDRVGRRLESMVVDPVELEDGREVLQFSLELSKKGLLSQPLAVPVSTDAAAQMVHPPSCLHGTRVSSPSGQRKRRRRRKRRP